MVVCIYGMGVVNVAVVVIVVVCYRKFAGGEAIGAIGVIVGWVAPGAVSVGLGWHDAI